MTASHNEQFYVGSSMVWRPPTYRITLRNDADGTSFLGEYR